MQIFVNYELTQTAQLSGMPTARLLPSLPLLLTAILHCCCCCEAVAVPPLTMLDSCPTEQSSVTAPLPQSVGQAVLLTGPRVHLQTIEFLNSGGLLRVETGSLVLNRSLDAAELTGPYSGPYAILCSDMNQVLGTFNIYLQNPKQSPPAKSIPTNTTTTTFTTTTIASATQVAITTPASIPTPSITKTLSARPNPHASVAQPPPPPPPPTSPPPASDPRVLPLAMLVGLLLALVIALSVALAVVTRGVNSRRVDSRIPVVALESCKPSEQKLLPSDDRAVA